IVASCSCSVFKMKLSLLTLGALAFSAQQASIVRGDGEGTDPVTPKNVCSPDKSLSFNVTQAGQSVVFTCGQTVATLDPTFNSTFPEMYEGNSKVRILEFLPGATLQEVKAEPESARNNDSEKTYNFTVPILPSDEHQLHVNCTASEAKRQGESTKKNCKVSF
ncbi:SAG-related sequence protein SRS22I, partial [Toxoplasma gondii RUB]